MISSSIKNILPKDSGNFNQGIMELGETICIPNGFPKCSCCPVQYYCRAHLNGRESLIPRKTRKKEKLEEEYTVFLIRCQNKFALRKRTDGLLKNMWEFPNERGFLTYEEVRKIIPDIQFIQLSITYTHVFSHKKWFLNSYYIEVRKELSEYVWVSIEEIDSDYAIPSAFYPFLDVIKK